MRASKLLLAFVAGILVIFACSTKLSEEAYYKKAKDAYGKQNFEMAITNFKHIVEYYPQGKRAAESLFMIGFINANDLKKYDEAKKYYSEFINKYPKHELAPSAKYELANLGKDINELPFLKQIARDSTAN